MRAILPLRLQGHEITLCNAAFYPMRQYVGEFWSSNASFLSLLRRINLKDAHHSLNVHHMAVVLCSHLFAEKWAIFCRFSLLSLH